MSQVSIPLHTIDCCSTALGVALNVIHDKQYSPARHTACRLRMTNGARQ